MRHIILFFLIFGSTLSAKNNTIDLSGEWNFSLDKENVGISEKWYTQQLNQTIKLPGPIEVTYYEKNPLALINDGKIIVRNKCTKGGNLMITKIAFLSKD